MRTRSPQRNRRIVYAAVIGSFVGFAVGLFGYYQFAKWTCMVFMPFGALIAGLAVSMSAEDYDRD